jgi:hypothetical protein
MKTTKLIILAALALFSCKKETPQPTNCQCREVTYVQGNQGYWTEQSSTAPTTMNCSANGTITDSWSVQSPAWTTNYKKQIVCE